MYIYMYLAYLGCIRLQGVIAMTDTFTPGAAICPSCGAAYLQDEPWKRVCLKCYLKAKGKTYTPPPVRYAVMAAPIEPGMLRRLIQLCHPDRHGNSEASNTATLYLLALKGAAHE